MGRWAARALSLAGWLLAAAAQAQSPRLGAPLPPWFDVVDVATPRDTNGFELLLWDEQLRVDARGDTSAFRCVYALHGRDAVALGSEVRIDVPSGTEVTIHHVRRLRDGVSTDALATSAVRITEPEDELDVGIVDGDRRALIFLADVRIGDVIDYAYSIRAPAALLGGRIAYASTLLNEVDAREVRFRASWPAGRDVATRLHDLSDFEVRESPSSIEVRAREVIAHRPPDDSPTWFLGAGWVEISEFGSWAEVVSWALPHFSIEPDEPLAHVPMDAIAADADPVMRATAALRFVADDVRYLGFEEGDRGVLPDRPDVVAERRWGDCKDKARLLVAILRALAIEADPVLVSAAASHRTGDRLPGPFAFDHVVVRASLGGRDVWMDPTLSGERERADQLMPIDIERGLVLAPGELGLTYVGTALPFPDVEIEERFDVERSGSATLEAVTIYHGHAAAAVRDDLDRLGAADLSERFRRAYEAEGFEPRSLAPARFEERPDGGLDVTERYALTAFFVEGARDISAWTVALGRAPAADRAVAPLSLPFPRHRIHRVVVRLPEGWDIDPSFETEELDGVHVERRVTVDGGRLDIETAMYTALDHVSADRVPAHRVERERLDALFHFEVVEGSGDAPSPESLAAVRAGATALAGLCCLGSLFVVAMITLGLAALHRGSSSRPG